MTDLHLVSWNRPKMTDLVIRTIHRNTARESYRLVVFDNGSDRDTLNMLVDLQENGFIDELHAEPTNVGLEKARQWMLTNSTESEYFVCIDNDCLPPPIDHDRIQDWLEKLTDLISLHPNHAAISMRTQVMIGTGNIFEEADALGDRLVDFPHPGGSFRIMRTQAVKDVGGWDRESEGRGAEERYICGKLRDAGWMTGFATNVRCLHLFGTRGAIATDRWGYDLSMKPEDSGHSDITHPALDYGDNFQDVKEYAGVALARRYFDAHRSN